MKVDFKVNCCAGSIYLTSVSVGEVKLIFSVAYAGKEFALKRNVGKKKKKEMLGTKISNRLLFLVKNVSICKTTFF